MPLIDSLPLALFSFIYKIHDSSTINRFRHGSKSVINAPRIINRRKGGKSSGTRQTPPSSSSVSIRRLLSTQRPPLFRSPPPRNVIIIPLRLERFVIPRRADISFFLSPPRIRKTAMPAETSGVNILAAQPVTEEWKRTREWREDVGNEGGNKKGKGKKRELEGKRGGRIREVQWHLRWAKLELNQFSPGDVIRSRELWTNESANVYRNHKYIIYTRGSKNLSFHLRAWKKRKTRKEFDRFVWLLEEKLTTLGMEGDWFWVWISKHRFQWNGWSNARGGEKVTRKKGRLFNLYSYILRGSRRM